MMISTMRFLNGLDHGIRGFVFGYTAIFLSFLLVYFGIRSFRDNQGHGQITFARGFAVGILITLISCAFYVVTWEVLYFNFMHGSMDSYFAHQIEKVQASGASAAAIQAQVAQIRQSKTMYENPLWNAMYTFIEPFPVGLLITLISAALLRKKKRAQAAGEALPAA
jgi:hypothetical protein